MTITASPLVLRETEAFKDDLWEPSAIFLHNWGLGGVVVNTSWRTAIQSSRSVSEQRYGLVNKPYRSIDMNLQGFNADQVKQLRATIMRMGKARMPLPLIPDRTRITGVVDLDLFIYSGDFTDRRFFVGGYAIGVNIQNSPVIEDFAIRQILAVTATTITLDGPLGDEYVAPNTPFKGIITGDGSDTSITLPDVPVESNQQIFAFIQDETGSPAAPSSVYWGSLGLHVIESGMWRGGIGIRTLRLYTGIVSIGSTNDLVVTWPSGFVARLLAVIVVAGAGSETKVTVFNVDEDPAQADPSIDITTSFNNSLVLVGHISDPDDAHILTIPPTQIDAEITLLDGFSGIDRYASVTRLVKVLAGVTTIEFGQGGSWVASGLIAVGIEGFKSPPMTHIYPAIEAELEFEHEAEAIHAKLATFSVQVVETPGVSALDPLVAPGTLPPGFPTHTQDSITHPVLTPPLDWRRVTVGVSRQGERSQAGIASVSEVFGTRPRARFLLPYTRVNRSDGFDMLRFFDSRGGRLHPFWLVSPTIDYELLAIDPAGAHVIIKAVGAEFDWAFFPYIALKQISTGTIIIRKINLVNRVPGGDDQIFLDIALPASLAIADHRSTSAHLVRFDTDAFPEGWITDELMQFELPVLELIDEKDVVITLDDLCPGGEVISYVRGGCDICIDDRCGTDEPGGCCICFTEPVLLVCATFDLADPSSCNDCTCVVVSEMKWVLPPIDCLAGIARWGNGNQWVTLNTNTAQWNWDLGDDECSGEVIPNQCLCDAGNDCPEIIDHACEGLTYLVSCNPSGANCNYVEAIKIICQSCKPASPKCATP